MPATNVPVRVVMEIQTEPTGRRSLAQRVIQKTGYRPGQWHLRLPARYFTNETAVAAVAATR